MRLFLVLFLVHGLAPGLAELGESALHLARAGHAAHHAGEDAPADAQDEHGCGTTQHLCACCPTQAVAPADEAVVASLASPGRGTFARAERDVTPREQARLFRPPIP